MTKKQPKLSDLQLILLSTASQRDDGNLLPLPDSARPDKSRTDRAISVLLAGGFVEEVEAVDSAHFWREVGDQRLVVSITAVGRIAIGTGDDIAPEAKPAADGDADSQAGPQSEPATSTPRAGPKQALLLEMLSRENGATIDELIDATGWLPHTTRAAISGLRKRGQDVSNERNDGISRYHLAEVAA
jgi:hypothetical protein